MIKRLFFLGALGMGVLGLAGCNYYPTVAMHCPLGYHLYAERGQGLCVHQ